MNQSTMSNVMEVVREMVWNDEAVRSTYESLRHRGFSAEQALMEIAKGYLECLWERSHKLPDRWPQVLSEIRGVPTR